MYNDFNEFLKRKESEYPDSFDPSDLHSKFVPYYESGQRIEIKTDYGFQRGYVGITTGWKPVFLLMSSPNIS